MITHAVFTAMAKRNRSSCTTGTTKNDEHTIDTRGKPKTSKNKKPKYTYTPLKFIPAPVATPTPIPQRKTLLPLSSQTKRISRRPTFKLLAEVKYYRYCEQLQSVRDELINAYNQEHAARLEKSIKELKRKIRKYAYYNTISPDDVSDDEDIGLDLRPASLTDISDSDEDGSLSFETLSPSSSISTPLSSQSPEIFPFEDYRPMSQSPDSDSFTFDSTSPTQTYTTSSLDDGLEELTQNYVNTKEKEQKKEKEPQLNRFNIFDEEFTMGD